VALRLHQRGLKRVRPLLGGLDGWRERGYPVEEIPEFRDEPIGEAEGSQA
jgi:3-mercaptopyruvate sulfurtransferase SseA